MLVDDVLVCARGLVRAVLFIFLHLFMNHFFYHIAVLFYVDE